MKAIILALVTIDTETYTLIPKTIGFQNSIYYNELMLDGRYLEGTREILLEDRGGTTTSVHR